MLMLYDVVCQVKERALVDSEEVADRIALFWSLFPKSTPTNMQWPTDGDGTPLTRLEFDNALLNQEINALSNNHEELTAVSLSMRSYNNVIYGQGVRLNPLHGLLRMETAKHAAVALACDNLFEFGSLCQTSLLRLVLINMALCRLANYITSAVSAATKEAKRLLERCKLSRTQPRWFKSDLPFRQIDGL
jgi:hypothetical protein